LVSKLSVWAPDRALAVERMRRALGEYVITGIRTNLAFHEKLFEHPEFVAGRYDTGFIDRHRDRLLGYASVAAPERRAALAVAAAVAAARLELGQGAATASAGRGSLSPWAAQHRARAVDR
ncbi:MAG TPA: hypothetical protein VFS00_10815, partial [Polyangiaceae bacterium]|nr:hypothetical protein [Polyangiaceae bacterium]